MDVIARPVDSLPHILKARGWLGWLVTRLIHGNSQCLGFCNESVKKPDYLALCGYGWEAREQSCLLASRVASELWSGWKPPSQARCHPVIQDTAVSPSFFQSWGEMLERNAHYHSPTPGHKHCHPWSLCSSTFKVVNHRPGGIVRMVYKPAQLGVTLKRIKMWLGGKKGSFS